MMELQPYLDTWQPDDPHANLKAEVAAYSVIDPLPTLENLSRYTGIPTSSLIRYVLVKYAASGAEALLAMTPIVLLQMERRVAEAEAAGTDSARLQAYEALRQVVAWLRAGQQESERQAGPPPATGRVSTLKMYGELAAWWPLLSAPDEYEEEAGFYRQTLEAYSQRPVQSVLELGSGGGNNASHLKRHYNMTLVDLSAEMLAVSQGLNPECEHVQGDMRTLRLGREFDAVFVHDAVMYMTSEADLRRAMATAYVHCRPGGLALFAPDYVRENFAPGTDHGGHDAGARGLRYLEWAWDPDEGDTEYTVDYAYLLREVDRSVTVEHDRHIEGLFRREDWHKWLVEAGFRAEVVPDPFGRELYVALKGLAPSSP